MTLVRAMGMTLALSILAACSGGTGNLTPVRNTTTPAPVGTAPAYTGATARVKATIVLPRKKAAATAANKKRAYVSPSTEGLIVEVDTVPSQGPASPYSYTAYDLTQQSALDQCTQNDSGTTCTIFLNAPVTTSQQSDAFYIYAYDEPQTPTGTIGSNDKPMGNLLSEDFDDAGGTVAANTDNNLTFTLGAVVASPEVSYGSSEAAPLGQATIVLSTSGDAATTGTDSVTQAFNVDGYDEDDNEILAYEDPNSEDYYYNPIQFETSSAGLQGETTDPSFSLSQNYGKSREPSLKHHRTIKAKTLGRNAVSGVGYTAQDDIARVTYTPGSADAPTSATAQVPSGTITFEDSFLGGFGDESGNPTTSYSTVTSALEIAPMYAYVDSGASSATIGNTGNIYAIAAAPATNANYTLSAASGDCSGYAVGTLDQADITSDQQAIFPITIGTDTGDGSACVLTLSDGMSNDTITLQPPTNSTTTNVTIPNANAAPVYQSSGTISSGSPFSFAARRAGDTLLCITSFYNADSLVEQNVTLSNSNDTLYTIGNTGNNQTYAVQFNGTDDSYSGEQVFAMTAQNAGDAMTNIVDSNPINYWCAEYANTSAAAISGANNTFEYFAEGSNSETISNTNTPGAILIQNAVSPPKNGSVQFDSGFAHNANVSGGAPLFVESSTGLEQASSGNQSWTPTVANGEPPIVEGFIQIPITQTNAQARTRSGHTRHK